MIRLENKDGGIALSDRKTLPDHFKTPRPPMRTSETAGRLDSLRLPDRPIDLHQTPCALAKTWLTTRLRHVILTFVHACRGQIAQLVEHRTENPALPIS